MEILSVEDLYSFLDRDDTIDSLTVDPFLESLKELLQKSEIVDKEKLEVEYKAFAIIKSIKEDPNDKISIDIRIPEQYQFSQQDYEYLENRFCKCKGVFAKAEYGLLVYFGGMTKFSKHFKFKQDLADALLKLSQHHWNKAINEDDSIGNYHMFYVKTESAFIILENIKDYDSLKSASIEIIELYQNWDVDNKYTYIVIYNFAKLFVSHFHAFKSIIDSGESTIQFEYIISKVISAAKIVLDTHECCAIPMCEQCIKIRQKIGSDVKDLDRKKAEIFELLARKEQNPLVRHEFVGEALNIYKRLRDANKITELSTKYKSISEEIHIEPSYFIIDPDFAKIGSDKIRAMVNKSIGTDIITNLIKCKWFNSDEVIRCRTNRFERQHPMWAMAQTSVLDKNNNVNKVYKNEQQIMYSNFWNIYAKEFNIGMTGVREFVYEAFDCDKMTYSILLSYFESTWYNEIIWHTYNGECKEIRVLDLLKPALQIFCDALQHREENGISQMYIILIIDSLTPKFETILRLMSERKGISTMKSINKMGTNIVMEKHLEDLLADIRQPILNEDDYMMLKYVLTLDGLNLRNRVAHGLIDYEEYSEKDLYILLYAIIKLSTYRFQNDENIR